MAGKQKVLYDSLSTMTDYAQDWFRSTFSDLIQDVRNANLANTLAKYEDYPVFHPLALMQKLSLRLPEAYSAQAAVGMGIGGLYGGYRGYQERGTVGGALWGATVGSALGFGAVAGGHWLNKSWGTKANPGKLRNSFEKMGFWKAKWGQSSTNATAPVAAPTAAPTAAPVAGRPAWMGPRVPHAAYIKSSW